MKGFKNLYFSFRSCIVTCVSVVHKLLKDNDSEVCMLKSVKQLFLDQIMTVQ